MHLIAGRKKAASRRLAWERGQGSWQSLHRGDKETRRRRGAAELEQDCLLFTERGPTWARSLGRGWWTQSARSPRITPTEHRGALYVGACCVTSVGEEPQWECVV
ncbi:unnamed protein product [Arctogadus glacialis]